MTKEKKIIKVRKLQEINQPGGSKKYPLNIPNTFIEILGYCKGDDIVMELDINNSTVNFKRCDK